MTSPSPAAFCKTCEYSLTGQASGVCPECGRAFDIADPATYDRQPRARRRRWFRRAAWAAGIMLAVELFAPSRVARFVWSWPNGDGTITTQTRWRLVAPEWFPLRYPGWRSSNRKLPAPAQLSIADCGIWRVGWTSWRCEMGIQVGNPPGSNPRMYGSLCDLTTGECADVAPAGLDTIEAWLLFRNANHLTWSPHVLGPRATPGIERNPAIVPGTSP